MLLCCRVIVGGNGGDSFSMEGSVYQVKHVCVMLCRCVVFGGSHGESLIMKGSA